MIDYFSLLIESIMKILLAEPFRSFSSFKKTIIKEMRNSLSSNIYILITKSTIILSADAEIGQTIILLVQIYPKRRNDIFILKIFSGINNKTLTLFKSVVNSQELHIL